MKQLSILVLLLISAASHGDDRSIRGKVISLTGDDIGIRLRLDSGVPPECRAASRQEILVKPNYPGAFHLAQNALGVAVEIEADYEPLQRECVAKVITLSPS
ncbi:hypothetical protein KOI40_12525 [Aestuariicella sp. G3-2]|uniref:hypothetical protein n=1 Tax=Pseudomaricurvus albidus TaxID=2842452 RepID=UPI001C0E1F16|nr:hypothetical protein [Aestuariicella albida]MBU3070649.1 hypothetical protein [Aestuariicella albida]